MLFVVKYFPEITIKSKPVRQQMCRRLQNNLANRLRSVGAGIKAVRDWDKLTVTVPDELAEQTGEIIAILENTPGIAYFLQVEQFEFDDLDHVCRLVLPFYEANLVDKTFVVRCKRSGGHEFSSHDAERYVGGFLNQNTNARGVDLKQPQVTVNIEIRQKTLFVVKQRFEGLGGFPMGEVEPVLSLLSGGFDSPVASYLSMKRGAPTHFCFFNLGGRDHELGVKEVAYYLWQKYSSCRRVKFISVPFEPVVAEILQNVENSQMGVILKRMMLRAAKQLAEKLEIKALLTGEALAQVSSQTLTNLTVIDDVTDMLVLRPLIMSDKSEIIDIARKIGTEEFAANMPEYCGVISVKPTTRARMHRVEKQESGFDFAVLEKAISEAQLINIDELAQETLEKIEVENFATPLPHATIIDIRHPDEVERKPLNVAGQHIEQLPFYQLHKAFISRDKTQKYLLYCDKGVMSKLHAAHLVEDGYAVAVYRPKSNT